MRVKKSRLTVIAIAVFPNSQLQTQT